MTAWPATALSAGLNLPPPCPALAGALQADVCIVGAGYTGLSAAIHLAQRGYDVVVLEAERVGAGASGRNGGQVGSGQRWDVPNLQAAFGQPHARALWDLGQEAKALVRALIAEHDIACGWQPGILYPVRSLAEARAARAEADLMARDFAYPELAWLNGPATRTALGSRYYLGAIRDAGAAHLNPLAYVLGLARAAIERGARIFEASRVTSIGDGPRHRITTAGGHVEVDFVITACNGYLGALAPPVAARVLPINNFIVATDPLPQRLIPGREAVADSRFVVRYFREDRAGRLIFGGGESYGRRFPRDIAARVRPALEEIYPALKGVALPHAWGGTLAVTRSRLPHFAAVAPGWLSASGYSGHGLAMATLAGRLLAERVAGQAERFDLMASLPTPAFPGGTSFRAPLLALAMTWFALRDRL